MEVTREQAYELLTEYTKTDSLIKHALAVETSMKAYARKFNEDEKLWGITGLIHDFDYEKWPQPPDHPARGVSILKESGYPLEITQAVLGHADYMGVKRETLMAKTLFAVDELSGFIVAVALVRPSKKIDDVTVKSVKKKLKDKAFARGVNRDDIYKGVEELGVDIDEHIAFLIEALKKSHEDLGI